MYRRGASKKDGGAAKAEGEGKEAELLVFGYACKVFGDEERALHHEQGHHLIPWMGDKNIMIDRYDGRGHLHDLSEYDAGSWNQSYQLSEEEVRIEALCDEERYLALHTDLLEEEARQEEEYKRLSEALADEGTYNAVAFRYSADYYDPSQPTEEEDGSKDHDPEPQEEDGEEPFVAPPGLIIPPDVELPATIKTHAIIERTANFVCKQGAQFEIVLKAKQAGNSQFDFLRFDHYLNPYYKHILRAMKEGRYTASDSKQDQATESKSGNSDDSDSDFDDNGDGSYLHPSLFAPKKSSRLEELMKPLQVMDPDHPLAALVRKAQQERHGAVAMAAKPEEETVAPAVGAVSSEAYASDANVATMYYGYCMLPDGTYCLAPPPPGIDASAYYSSLPGAMMPAHSASGAPPPPGTTPPPELMPTAPSAPAAAPPPVPVPVAHSAPASLPTTSSYGSQVSVVQPVAPAAPAAPAAIIPPPPDIQPVIDKLAEYVARNGLKFESSVRAKNDPRFDFLQSWHQYNTYYEFKKHYFMQKEGVNPTEVTLDVVGLHVVGLDVVGLGVGGSGCGRVWVWAGLAVGFVVVLGGFVILCVSPSPPRSRSRSPGRRERHARSTDRRREERDRYAPASRRLGNSPGLGRKRSRSRSRSPREKRKRKTSRSQHQSKALSSSPPASPERGGAYAKVSALTASSSPTTSPTSSLSRSRDSSQEKDKPVSSTIISSVQSKITQDLMAKVRAMLAASKTLQANPT
ncbi:splicing factor, suppressor of white-apricot homolog [Brachyhypopomus gauderio]|uniref:splicing factor, suppressor of white-apricot homolog n=1 Tax=Brachyhypopomus gauderio TaxID=698409 RepID=UPI0040410A28